MEVNYYTNEMEMGLHGNDKFVISLLVCCQQRFSTLVAKSSFASEIDRLYYLTQGRILLIDSVTKLTAGLKMPALVSSPLKTEGQGFAGALASALTDVSKSQKLSGDLVKAFTVESTTVSLEEVMLAGVKSNIGFQATLQIRNRLVQAYSDVMNMQI